MIRNSPIKGPMQKLSRVTTKLANRGSAFIDSASTAVAQGAQLSNAVASKANAKAEEIATQMRSPEKRKKRSSIGGGIRDKIHKFDSASKSNAGYEYRQQQYRRRRRQHTSPGDVSPRGEEQQLRERVGNSSGYETMPQPIPPPPCNLNFNEKENEPKQKSTTDYSFTSKGDVRKLSPARRRKKNGQKRKEALSAPVNPNYRENKGEVARNENETKRSHCKNYETDRNPPRGSRNSDFKRQEGSDHHTTVENMASEDIADLNRAAVIRNSKQKTTPTYSHTAIRSNNQKHFNTTNTSYGVQRITKKRLPNDHPLIQSSLRKHIKGVHDSACSNATCTVIKDPFPLLPPECNRPLAAVANWEDGRSGSSGGGGGGMMGHLNTLGAVTTGKLKSRDFIGYQKVNAGKAAGRGSDDPSSGGAAGKKDGEGAALDLLSSAAFLFKDSKRNLA